MTKEEYKVLLKSPKWKKKRLEILKRDCNMCTTCNKTTRLQVHHKYYIEGRLPWEYSDNALITVCNTCHQKIHDTTKIQVIKKLKTKENTPNKKKKGKKKPKLDDKWKKMNSSNPKFRLLKWQQQRVILQRERLYGKNAWE